MEMTVNKHGIFLLEGVWWKRSKIRLSWITAQFILKATWLYIFKRLNNIVRELNLNKMGAF